MKKEIILGCGLGFTTANLVILPIIISIHGFWAANAVMLGLGIGLLATWHLQGDN